MGGSVRDSEEGGGVGRTRYRGGMTEQEGKGGW